MHARQEWRSCMRLSKLTMLCAATLLLGGCWKTTGTGGTECLAWRPISWSRADTPQTITEVKANNAKWRAFCEGVRP